MQLREWSDTIGQMNLSISHLGEPGARGIDKKVSTRRSLEQTVETMDAVSVCDIYTIFQKLLIQMQQLLE